MQSHKPNCIWPSFRQSLTSIDPNGPDRSLTINEEGIEYEANIYKNTPEDRKIEFNFCPICGAQLREIDCEPQEIQG